MIATLIQVSVMRSASWSVDVRLLSFAREGAQIRGLLVLKTGWAGFDFDRPPQRRLYGNLLWRFRFDMPLERATVAAEREAEGKRKEILLTNAAIREAAEILAQRRYIEKTEEGER